MKNKGETIEEYESDKTYARKTSVAVKHDKAGAL
jgi:hypothetical protein